MCLLGFEYLGQHAKAPPASFPNCSELLALGLPSVSRLLVYCQESSLTFSEWWESGLSSHRVHVFPSYSG